MLAIFQELILSAQLQIAESIYRRSVMQIECCKSVADFDRKVRRDAFRNVYRNVRLARSSIPGVLIVLTVGSESSSATKGSSVVSVAGKNRAPAKPWA